MNSKRATVVTNPRLRKIRNNLRSLIISACSEEKSKILDEEEKLRENHDFYDNDKYRKLSRALNDRSWAIEGPLRASILLCPACFKSDRDMIYNPVRKVWYCTDCYELLKQRNEERGTPEEFP